MIVLTDRLYIFTVQYTNERKLYPVPRYQSLQLFLGSVEIIKTSFSRPSIYPLNP